MDNDFFVAGRASAGATSPEKQALKQPPTAIAEIIELMADVERLTTNLSSRLIDATNRAGGEIPAVGSGRPDSNISSCGGEIGRLFDLVSSHQGDLLILQDQVSRLERLI